MGVESGTDAIERRDMLAGAETAETLAWECFIAVCEGDMVRTLSGNAVEFEVERGGELRFDTRQPDMLLPDEITVRVRFVGTVVEELRPYDGKVGE